MKTKTFGLLSGVFVAAMAFAPVAFACESGECDPPTDPVKGDNGWGNGGDSTNAGSDDGGTNGSKSINGYGTGPGPTKFTER